MGVLYLGLVLEVFYWGSCLGGLVLRVLSWRSCIGVLCFVLFLFGGPLLWVLYWEAIDLGSQMVPVNF